MTDDKMIEAVARAMVAASNGTKDPDKLVPAPRGSVGMIPLWRSYEHLAQAALRAVREGQWQDIVVIPLGHQRQKFDNGICAAWTQKVERNGDMAIITVTEDCHEGMTYQPPRKHTFALKCIEFVPTPPVNKE